MYKSMLKSSQYKQEAFFKKNSCLFVKKQNFTVPCKFYNIFFDLEREVFLVNSANEFNKQVFIRKAKKNYRIR